MNPISPTLVRFESQLEDAIRRHGRRRTRRLAIRIAVVGVAGAAIGLGVLSAAPDDGPLGVVPGTGPSVVARAAAALGASDGAILHVVSHVTVTRPDGKVETGRSETWQQTSPPYDMRHVSGSGNHRRELAQANGALEAYDAQTNTILTTAPGVAPVTGPFLDTGGQRLRERILALLRSGDASEDGRLTVDGRQAIRFVSGSTMTLVVDASSYEPIEWRAVADDGTIETTRFEAYERLPATEANAALPSLRTQHPEATLDPGGITIEGR